MAKKIPYNAPAVRLRHDVSGDGADTALACVISISRTDSTANIVDEEEALQYGVDWAEVPLFAAASAGDVSISLDPNLALNPKPNDRFKIAASDDGPAEIVECNYYDSSPDVMYLKSPLLHGHSSGTRTNAMFFTYDIDTETDIADYELNAELQVIWKVSDDTGDYSTGLSASSIYKVSKQVYDSGAIKSRFRDVYPRVYDTSEPRWDSIEEEAYRRVKNYLLTKGRDIDTLTNPDLIEPAMMEQIYLLAAPRTDEYEYERTDSKMQLDAELIRLEQMPIWFDEDQDTVKDDNEINLTAWDPHGRHM